MSSSGPANAVVRERHPFVEMLFVATPTVVTMTSYTVMQFIDGLMVSRIGPDPVYVSAQGNGGMAVWLVVSIALGAMGVINTYVAQNLGAGRPERGSAYAWNGLWMSAAWALLMVPYALSLPAIFGAMGHGDELLRLETQYAQINVWGAFFVLGSRSIAHYFYGLHRPGVVMVSVLAANVVNVALNALLIFGTDGPPAWTPLAGFFRSTAETLGIAPMGVAGAAVATVIGASIELLIPLAVFLSPRMNRRYATRSAWRPSLRHVRDVWRIGWPGGLMFGNEMICWAYLMAVLLGKGGQAMGDPPEVHNTAGWIALRYMHLSFMPAVGISIAVTALVGRCMGMRRPDLAARRAWLGMGVTMAYMGACALGFVLFRETLVGVFVPDDMPSEKVERLIAVGSSVMIAAAVFQLFDAIAITMSGALRGAGDTVWPGVVTIVLSWVCIVGGGHLAIALVPHWGSMGPWVGASAYIILLGVFLLARFLAGNWKRIDLLSRSASAGEPDLAAAAEAVAPASPGQA